MSKINNSRKKYSRKIGISLHGDEIPNTRPGQHGRNTRNKTSNYGEHLRQKQILKGIYGESRINEKQFLNKFKQAAKKKGNTAENFSNLLERRVDSVLYRTNVAPTIFAARQMISHKQVMINNQKITVPSIELKDGDIISLTEKGKKTFEKYKESCKDNGKMSRVIPEYIQFEDKDQSVTFIRSPQMAEIPYPSELDMNKVIEFYSH
ncbi:MAG TPA: 30S ribosomal protein S4 [Candidatus Megaira endosymbiont of Hartmannula sinica]|nr:30S ribosomal protein S4 [Candidatus Megaera endosymbiont of Hartmannula sinica]